MDKALELADALDWVCENHLVGIGDADFKATATMLRQQQAEIEALKELNTMLKDAIEKRIRMDAERYSAHPVKLTDEEIIKVYEDMLGVASAKGSAIDFARAILKKAQEK